MNRNNSAFTLIELLVVIAIISILTAILFPVFASAREKARQAMCSSNEKEIALSILQYTQDFDEVFPPGGEYNSTGYNSTWCSEVLPYVKSTAVFICPDDPLKITPTNYASWEGPLVSYIANGDEETSSTYPYPTNCQGVMCVVNNIPSSPRPTTSQALINQPAVSVMFSESIVSDFPTTGTFKLGAMYYNGLAVDIGQSWSGSQYQRPDGSRAWQSNPNDPTGPNGGVTGIHNGLANVAFCDGHVKAMPPYLTDPNSSTQPQNDMWIVTR